MRILIGLLILSQVSLAWAGAAVTFHGRILDQDDKSVEAAAVTFKIQVRSPGTQNCLLYEETRTLDMRNSGGIFVIPIGDGHGHRSAGDPGITVENVFSNDTSLNLASLACNSGNSYQPQNLDSRRLVVSFDDGTGSGEQLLPEIDINQVPFAIHSYASATTQKVGTVPASQVMSVASGAATPLSAANFTELLSLVNGTSNTYLKASALPNCGAGQVLKAMSGALVCVADDVGTDSDMLAGISCPDGKILKRVSGAWACADESGVGVESDPTVSAFAKNTPGTGLVVDGANHLSVDFGTVAGKAVQGNDPRLSDARAPIGTATGDLAGSYPNPSVKGIRGNAVATTAPQNGQVYQWVNGSTEWQPKYVSFADLKKADGTPQMPATCAANETLSWSAITDVFTCAAIGSLDASKITGGTLAYARLPVGTAASTVAAGDDSRFLNATKLNGVSLNFSSLTAGQFLKYDGLNWSNAADNDLLTTLACPDGKIVKHVSGSWACADESGVGVESDPTVAAYAKLAPATGLIVNGSNKIAPDFGTTAGKIVEGNDVRLSDSRPPNGTAGGELAGSYPNPTVAKLAGVALNVSSLTSGQLLKYNGTNWANSADADALGGLSCADGKIVKRVAGVWACGDDSGVGTETDPTVAAYAKLAPATGLIVNGSNKIAPDFGTGAGKVVEGNDARFPSATCATGSRMRWDGTAWQCEAVVSSVAAGNGLTGGTITSTGTLAVDTGTGANKIVQLDGAGKLPAVDGSALTNLNAANLTGSVNAARLPAFTGDMTTSAGSTSSSVVKVRGVAVSATAPTAAGQLFRYDGSQWAPAYVGLADLRSTQAGNAAIFPTNCGASQTLTYSAGTDTYSCTNVSVAASAVTSGVFPAARLGTGSADSSTFLRGDGTWASPPVGGGGGDGTWTTITSDTSLLTNSSYMANGASQLVLTLPSTCALGDTLRIMNVSSAGYQLVIPSGISLNAGSATYSANRSYFMTSVGATLDVVCSAANATWSFYGPSSPTAFAVKYSMAVSYRAACAIFGANKDLKCWGYNSYGQVAPGDTTDRCASGGYACIANLPAINLGTGRSAKKVAIGDRHICVLMDNNQIKCWGYNGNGQLGYGDTTNRCNSGGNPACVASQAAVDLGSGRSAADILVGGSTTCVILDNGQMKCWGDNSNGVLGQGDTTARCNTGGTTCVSSLPAIDFGSSRTALKMSIGSTHACAVLSDSTVKCWGYNGHGQLGVGSTTQACNSGGTSCVAGLPASYLPGGRTAKDIFSAYHATCVIMDNNMPLCWGNNSYGELGDGTTTARCNAGGVGCSTSLPVQMDLGSGRTAKKIAMTTQGTCVLMDNNQVKCFGRSNQGQAGAGSTASVCNTGGTSCVASLAAIDFGSGRTVRDIYQPSDWNGNGSWSLCAILDNDQIKCWGYNANGQLGYGDTTSRCNTGGTSCMSSLSYVMLESAAAAAPVTLYGGGSVDTGNSCTTWGAGVCSSNAFSCRAGTPFTTGYYTYSVGCNGYSVTSYLCVQ